MQRIQVQSTNIRSIGYDSVSATLEVEFASGDIYQYFNVPELVFQNFLRAASPGQYLNENIVRYNYRYRKIY